MARKHVLAVVGAALALGATVFATGAASQQTRPIADDPNNANLTYWYWAEPDAPGANAWLKEQVAAYEKAHPKVKITSSPVDRHADLGLHDGRADQERPRHRHAVGDAAGANPGLERRLGADLRLRARQRDQELDRHVGEHVGRQALGDAAVPAGHPVHVEQGDVQEGRSEPEQGPEDLGGVPGRRQEAQGRRLHAVRLRQQGRLRRRLVLLADRQAEPQLDQRAQGGHDRQGRLRQPEVLRLLPGARRPEEEGLPQLRRGLDQLRAGPAAVRPEEGRDGLGHRRQRRRRGQDARRRKAMGVERRSRAGARASSRPATTPRSRRPRSSPSGRSTPRRRRSS